MDEERFDIRCLAHAEAGEADKCTVRATEYIKAASGPSASVRGCLGVEGIVSHLCMHRRTTYLVTYLESAIDVRFLGAAVGPPAGDRELHGFHAPLTTLVVDLQAVSLAFLYPTRQHTRSRE